MQMQMQTQTQSQVIITSSTPLTAEHREAIEATGAEVVEVNSEIDSANQLVARIERLSETASLTPDEARVFEGVVMGDSNTKIARTLDLTSSQVSNAVRRIVGKLNEAMPVDAQHPTITGRDALVWHSHAFYLQ